MVDDFYTASWPTKPPPDPQATLSCREVLTLTIVGQGQGFGRERCEGAAWQQAGHQRYGGTVLCPPKRHRTRPWPQRWLAGVRQIVETVYDQLSHTLRLDRERPHELQGWQARLTAKITLHNFCRSIYRRL